MTMSEAEEQRDSGERATCHICGNTFPTELELANHLMEDHQADGLKSNER